MRRCAFGERDGVVHGGLYEWVGELRPGSIDPNQAGAFGPGERAGAESGYPRRHLGAVGDRGEQQRCPCRGRKDAELGGDHPGEPVGQGERLGGPAPRGSRVGGDHLRQFDQRQRVADRLREYLLPGPAARWVRLRVEQPPGLRHRKRGQDQFGEVPVEPGRGNRSAGGEQQDERFGLQAPRGEGERVQRCAVQPLCVVGGHQYRAVLGQPGQQREYGDSGEQGVGCYRVGGKCQGT
jgi:hypothetical protein